MKTRKLITGILIFLVAMIAFAVFSKADAASSGLGYVKITKDRTSTVSYQITIPNRDELPPDIVLPDGMEPGMTYTISDTAVYRHQLNSAVLSETKNIWKLVTSTAAGVETSTATDLYCIRAGLGFTREPGTGGLEYNPQPVLYDQEFNMVESYEYVRDYLEGLKSETTIFKNIDNFNSVMGILDNILLQDANDNALNTYLKDNAGYTDETLALSQTKDNVLSRADIEAIQQLAIWYFTNSEETAYHTDVKVNNVTLPSLSPIYLNVMTESSSYYTNGKYENMSDIFNTNVDGNQYGTMRQTAAENLYRTLIAKGKSAANAAKANTDKLYHPNRDVTVYLAKGGNAGVEQPIVRVKEKTGEADISLRKFISAVNSVELDGEDSRKPDVNTINLNRGTVQTAEYIHNKKPVSVQIGDIVTYTIRVYNEGEVDAYVKEIKDYIPSYLAYAPTKKADGTTIDDMSAWNLDEYGYVGVSAATYDENGNVDLTKPYCKVTGASENLKDKIGQPLASVLIPKAVYNEDKKDTKDRYTLSYVDVQISCKVMKQAEYDTPITNIAEVSSMKDKDGLTLKDRDSRADNVTVPSESDLPNYKNEEIAEDENNVPGQQDDDDFDKVIVNAPVIDLALRKFITKVGDDLYDRAPTVDTRPLRNGTGKTAIYTHNKEAVPAEIGKIVTYTMRIYNEGDVPGKVHQITDYVDKSLKYVRAGKDTKNPWWTEQSESQFNKIVSTEDIEVVGVGGKVSANNIGKKISEVVIPAYDKVKDQISYIDIEITLEVQDVEKTTKLTNIAEITLETDEYDKPVVEDRDSIPGNVDVPNADKLPDYKNDKIKEDENNVPGQEDDDDFEKVLIKVPEIDLALRKFITAVDGVELEGDDIREPEVNTDKLDKYDDTTAEYIHPKTPVTVRKGGEVTYKIRVYNEGELDAYVAEITDYLPNDLIYLKDNETNLKYGWEYNEGTREVKTTITAENSEAGDEVYKERENGKKLLAYDNKGNPDYIDVEIVCKVDEKAIGNDILTNLAQITEIRDVDGEKVEDDRDSTPNGDFELPQDNDRPNYKDDESDKPYVPGQEDDDDFEKVKVKPDFDLALRKFITRVGTTNVNDRIPNVKYEDGKFTYEHTKKPLDVVKGDTVIYTIRIFNEGEVDGFAEEITDNMPEGLEFLVDNEVNREYKWKMLDENKKETKDVKLAKYIVTDYLSKEEGKEANRDNEIKAFDRLKGVTEDNPDYRDVKVAFKVVYEAKTTDEAKRTIVNVAQISEDSNDDIDSNPTKDENYDPDGDNEDDIDYEQVKVKYFDLSLLKWITQTQVTLKGQPTVVTDTGHTAANAKNEDVVKVPEIKSKDIKNVTIKFKYSIQVTNEGEIEGYATEVKDYIPEGLKFVKEDNTEWKWKEAEDGTVTTDFLAGKLLKPGDSAEVPIVLTWINDENNLGEKVNIAEISKHKNDSDSPDVDSTPNNKVPGEDDIDDAKVILAIKTGGVQTYICLTLIILTTFGCGVGLIKKYVIGL